MSPIGMFALVCVAVAVLVTALMWWVQRGEERVCQRREESAAYEWTLMNRKAVAGANIRAGKLVALQPDGRVVEASSSDPGWSPLTDPLSQLNPMSPMHPFTVAVQAMDEHRHAHVTHDPAPSEPASTYDSGTSSGGYDGGSSGGNDGGSSGGGSDGGGGGSW